MSLQKALVLTAKQGAWAVNSVPIPTLGAGQVLVKIEAAALNPVDWKIQTWGFIRETYPAILGMDGAGVIVDVGPGVTDRKKGDRVLFQGNFTDDNATFQQYAVTTGDLTAPIPANISFDQAASLPTALFTVGFGLWNDDANAPADWGAHLPAPWKAASAATPVLILGGASSVGQVAIQAAKLAGYSPIITTASLHNSGLLTALGATHVLDRALPDPEILEKATEINAGKPLTLVYDAIAAPATQALGWAALAPGGTLVRTFAQGLSADALAEGAKEGKKVAWVNGLATLPINRTLAVELVKRLPAWLEQGVFKPNPVEVLPNGLQGIPDGLTRLKENKVSAAKLIAHPQETA